MKKKICLVGMWLVFVSLLLLSCTSAQKTIITKETLPTLQGTWGGWTSWSNAQVRPGLTNLQINKTTIPIAGTITWDNVPQQIVNTLPSSTLPAGNYITINFNDGQLTDQGTISVQLGMGNFFEFTLLAGEKMKMNGWFFYYGIKGTMDLTKK